MKYLILGAGPAGLSLANKLKQMGEDNFLVLEMESEAGGLCRSVEVAGAPMDIGGGHFLDTKRQGVVEFLFGFMQESEWNRYIRDSQIVLKGRMIGHPFESHIWQLDDKNQAQYLLSISEAGCVKGEEEPDTFMEWIRWKLGKRIADDYMLPYNRKMFGNELNELGTYWLEKLPNVSYEDTLKSCLEKRPYGDEPGHAFFYYPKEYGYGEVWKRMADAIGDRIEYGKRVTELNPRSCSIRTDDGLCYNAESIISTIPWESFSLSIEEETIRDDVTTGLKHTSIVTQYYDCRMDTSAHWIYYPDEDVSYHRRLVRHNFCERSDGYWTETRAERFEHVIDNETSFLMKYAYPLNTVNKPAIMKRLLAFMSDYNVYGLGRWGEHQHYNSDVVVEKAIQLAEKLVSV